MGHALKKSDQIGSGRRPSKVLRQRNIQLVNLGSYVQSAPLQVPGTHPKQARAKQAAPQKTRSEYVKLESQPFDTKAANNDTVSNQPRAESPLHHTSPKNQLTLVIMSSLCIGSLVGYQWSSLLNLTQTANNKTESEFVASGTASAIAEPTEITAAASTAPIELPAQTVVAIDREQQQYLLEEEEENEYLSQIDWLKNQNSVLVSEIDILNAESAAQNHELLTLELEVFALQSQSEPITETRVVYNFVNVPIGSSTPVVYDGANAQYDEDALEDSDSQIALKVEQQLAQYNEEGQRIYDLETGTHIGGENSNDYDYDYDYDNAGSLSANSTENLATDGGSFETVNAELLNELQQVQLRQFEAGLLDYDHATGTFVQKDFSNTINERNSYPPIPSE